MKLMWHKSGDDLSAVSVHAHHREGGLAAGDLDDLARRAVAEVTASFFIWEVGDNVHTVPLPVVSKKWQSHQGRWELFTVAVVCPYWRYKVAVSRTQF